MSATQVRSDHVNQRSLAHIIWDLMLTSRLNNPGCLFSTFGGVLSALLAGLTKSRDGLGSVTKTSILGTTVLCFLHCIFLGAAGNTWNDWVDRDIDAKVARTKTRPLASGRLSTAEAIAWIFFLYLTSAGVLFWMVDGHNVFKLILPLTMMIMLYPYGKRPMAKKFHLYPQYILGAALGGSTLSGCSAIYKNELSFREVATRCFPLQIFLFFWSFYSNTAYSYQDVIDDRKSNVNSAYNLAGHHIRAFIAVLGAMNLLTIPLVLGPVGSVWLWLSWGGAWVIGVARGVTGFDPRRPETGHRIHLYAIALGVWAILSCLLQLLTLQIPWK